MTDATAAPPISPGIRSELDNIIRQFQAALMLLNAEDVTCHWAACAVLGAQAVPNLEQDWEGARRSGKPGRVLVNDMALNVAKAAEALIRHDLDDDGPKLARALILCLTAICERLTLEHDEVTS